MLSADESKAFDFYHDRKPEQQALIRMAIEALEKKPINGLKLPEGTHSVWATLSVQIEAYRAAYAVACGGLFISSHYRPNASWHTQKKAIDISGVGDMDLSLLYGMWNYLANMRQGNFGFGIGLPPAALHVHLDMGRPSRYVFVEMGPPVDGKVTTKSAADSDWQAIRKKVYQTYMSKRIVDNIRISPERGPSVAFAIAGGALGTAWGYAKGEDDARAIPTIIYGVGGVAAGYLLDRISEFKLDDFLRQVFTFRK